MLDTVITAVKRIFDIYILPIFVMVTPVYGESLLFGEAAGLPLAMFDLIDNIDASVVRGLWKGRVSDLLKRVIEAIPDRGVR